MVVAYLAGGRSKHLSPALLMVLFALLMLVIDGLMLFQKRNDAGEENGCTQPEHHNLWLTLASGTGVGLLTSILGVGGGFLTVPALVMLVGMPIYQAVGISPGHHRG